MTLIGVHDMHLINNYPTSSDVSDQVESQYPDASVTYSNIKYGEIGSTYQN